MLSLFDVDPKIPQQTKHALNHAANELKEAAEEVAQGPAPQVETWRQHSVLRALPRESASAPLGTAAHSKIMLRLAVEQMMKADGFWTKGPGQNARDKFDEWADRAIKAGYAIHHPKVQKAFYAALMVFVTEEFDGKNVTGTQMGNYNGNWRGFGGQL
jgi:hypothetical protein